MAETTQSFKEYLKKNLNSQQQSAVKEKNGIFLVIAGAGSGKTRVITSRIINLIVSEQVDPHTIVALTFTNKAANEMRSRIMQFLGDDTAVPFLGTFHSYCLRILRSHADILDKPFEAILDEDDKKKLLSGIIKRNGLGKRITAKKLAYNISQVKNATSGNSNDMDNLLQADPLLRELYSAYEYEKQSSKCFDFDDLLIEAVRLFEKNPGFKKEFQDHIKHILVDEYQDTNVVQHLLLKQMTLDEKNKFSADSLCVVGDEDQSIYSWRGATIANMIHFKKEFKDVKLIKIEQNYRSVNQILQAANQIIKNNQKRNPKKLWSEKKGTNRIKTISCSSEYQEGEVIARFLKTASDKQPLKTIALLYRAHYQSRAIEETLIKNSIPYKIIGGIQFYERKEIKDILAYLRLVVNPFDRVSFFRVINCPNRKLGPKFEQQFYELWNQNIFSEFKDIAKQLITENCLPDIKQNALKNFIKIFEKIDRDTKPSVAIEKIMVQTAYQQFLKDSCEKTEAETRIDNLKELVRATKFMEDQGIESISQFLQEVALMQASPHALQQEEQKDHVTLMTLHAAKGLEFHTIIIVGIEEGILPSARSMYNEDMVEEERRLFYVGITRAKERLLLTHSDYRYAFGQTSYQIPSRFLNEISQNLQNQDDVTRANTTEIDSIFCNWLGIKQTQKTSSVLTFGTARKSSYAKEKSPSPSLAGRGGLWKKNQPVSHKKFGIGVIQKIEHRGEDKIYITAKFKTGIKKLDSKFLTKI
ncbi:ATP-dependent helicase [Candidatus Dependentiae bacterium]